MRRPAIALMVTLVIGGCATTFDATSLGVPTRMAEGPTTAVQGTDFSVSKKAVFLLFGVIPMGSPSAESALAGQVVDGSEIANVRIKVRSRFWDIFLTVVTGGLIVPRTVTFEGTVIGGGANVPVP